MAAAQLQCPEGELHHTVQRGFGSQLKECRLRLPNVLQSGQIEQDILCSLDRRGSSIPEMVAAPDNRMQKVRHLTLNYLVS